MYRRSRPKDYSAGHIARLSSLLCVECGSFRACVSVQQIIHQSEALTRHEAQTWTTRIILTSSSSYANLTSRKRFLSGKAHFGTTILTIIPSETACKVSCTEHVSNQVSVWTPRVFTPSKIAALSSNSPGQAPRSKTCDDQTQLHRSQTTRAITKLMSKGFECNQ